MKTITMPANIDPIRVDINGVKYEYRAGQTVEVPDEVAALIENIIANEPTNMPYTKFATEEYVDNTLLVDEDDEIPTFSGGADALNPTGTPPTPTIPVTEG